MTRSDLHNLSMIAESNDYAYVHLIDNFIQKLLSLGMVKVYDEHRIYGFHKKWAYPDFRELTTEQGISFEIAFSTRNDRIARWRMTHDIDTGEPILPGYDWQLLGNNWDEDEDEEYGISGLKVFIQTQLREIEDILAQENYYLQQTLSTDNVDDIEGLLDI